MRVPVYQSDLVEYGYGYLVQYKYENCQPCAILAETLPSAGKLLDDLTDAPDVEFARVYEGNYRYQGEKIIALGDSHLRECYSLSHTDIADDSAADLQWERF